MRKKSSPHFDLEIKQIFREWLPPFLKTINARKCMHENVCCQTDSNLQAAPKSLERRNLPLFKVVLDVSFFPEFCVPICTLKSCHCFELSQRHQYSLLFASLRTSTVFTGAVLWRRSARYLPSPASFMTCPLPFVTSASWSALVPTAVSFVLLRLKPCRRASRP